MQVVFEYLAWGANCARAALINLHNMGLDMLTAGVKFLEPERKLFQLMILVVCTPHPVF